MLSIRRADESGVIHIETFMMNKIVFLFVLLLSVNLNAGTVGTSTSITNMYVYTAAGVADDITLTVETHIAGCESGFWLSGADAKAHAFMPALLLSAFHTGATVYFNVYDDVDKHWIGSGGKYCKINLLGLEK